MPHAEALGNPDVTRTGVPLDEYRQRYFARVTFAQGIPQFFAIRYVPVY